MIKIILNIFTIFLTLIIWWIVIDQNKEELLKVSFLDVGQGDSILIEAPNRNQILIDTGPNKKVIESLGKVMKFYDKSIDGILLTHPDLDHIGGTVPVLDTLNVDFLFFSSSTKETEVTKEIDKITLRQAQSKKVELSKGDKVILDGEKEIYLEVLYPDGEYISEDANDNSLVTKLVYKDTCFIFTGDASKTVEFYLVNNYQNFLNCGVLKVGHHGSNSSSAEEFIGFVSPEYGIISAGKENKFSHPHQEVLDLLKRFNVEILNTADLGNIIFTSDGENVSLIN
jgi:competence protein ComEC